MAENSVVLSYEDSLLRVSDVNLLDSPNWLNDAVIGFCFEYFANEEFSSNPFTFVSPEVTQFMKFADPSELGLFLEPLDLSNKEAVFLAVNNNSDTSKTGGSHWSLLLYRRLGNQFEHYDSSSGSNSNIAASLARKMSPYLDTKTEPKFKEISNASQQVNSHDCGVYCICFTHYLARQLAGLTKNEVMGNIINPASVTGKRKDLKNLIYVLAKKR